LIIKIIKNIDELLLTYAKEMWREMRGLDYDYYHINERLHYDCGCGEQHILRDTEYNLITMPMSFIFECNNNYMTAVRVKGSFVQRSIELWSCTSDLFAQAQERKIKGS